MFLFHYHQNKLQKQVQGLQRMLDEKNNAVEKIKEAVDVLHEKVEKIKKVPERAGAGMLRSPLFVAVQRQREDLRQNEYKEILEGIEQLHGQISALVKKDVP